MINIELTSKRGDFVLYEDDEPILNLKRSDWHSANAITTYLGLNLVIEATNIWKTKFDILENDHCIGTIKVSRSSGIEIMLLGQNYEKHNYTLRRKGLLKPKFDLYASNHRHILTMLSSFNWSYFNFDYTIKEKTDLPEDLDIYELLMYCTYAANLYLKKKGWRG